MVIILMVLLALLFLLLREREAGNIASGQILSALALKM